MDSTPSTRQHPDPVDAPRLALPNADGTATSLHFPQLDSLRGWAVLLVVLFHYSGILVGDVRLAEGEAWWRSWVIAGNTGVTLFFVLSGFLLSLPMVIGRSRGVRPRLGAFYLSRIFRIVPLYYLAILVAWLATRDTRNALRATMFVPVGYAMFPYGLVWWSLCTEVQFYLLLPVAMMLSGHRVGRWVVGAGLLLWLALYARFYRLAWWMESIPHEAWRASLFGRAPNFLAGMMTAWLYARGRGSASAVPGVLRGVAVLGAAAGLVVLQDWVARAGFAQADLRFPFWHAFEGAAWASLLLGSLRSTTKLAVLWDNRLMRELGKISYGVFLFHLPLQFVLLSGHAASSRGDAALVVDADVVLRVVASAFLTVAVAALCHRLVEEPFRRFRTTLRR